MYLFYLLVGRYIKNGFAVSIEVSIADVVNLCTFPHGSFFHVIKLLHNENYRYLNLELIFQIQFVGISAISPKQYSYNGKDNCSVKGLRTSFNIKLSEMPKARRFNQNLK